jgi:PTS system sucrose-specific IIC component
MAITVIPGTLLYLNENIFMYILVNVVAIGVAFTLTWLFGYSDKKAEEITEE